MSDVFSVLRADHREVEEMLAALAAGPDGAAPIRSEARKQLTDKLIIESSKHEAAEEQYFWPAVRGHLPNGTPTSAAGTCGRHRAE